MIAYPETIYFLFGATAHFPNVKRCKSDRVLIDLNQHPIIYSRAICAVRPGEKSTRNEVYLKDCVRACVQQCPIRMQPQLNVVCKRLSTLRALAETRDRSEWDTDQWAEVLKTGLCRPVFY